MVFRSRFPLRNVIPRKGLNPSVWTVKMTAGKTAKELFMKKSKILVLGLITLMLVGGLVLTSCETKCGGNCGRGEMDCSNSQGYSCGRSENTCNCN